MRVQGFPLLRDASGASRMRVQSKASPLTVSANMQLLMFDIQAHEQSILQRWGGYLGHVQHRLLPLSSKREGLQES